MDPILDEAPCGFVTFGDDGVVLLANRTLLHLVERDADGVVGRHIESLLAPGSRIFYQTHLFPLLRLRGKVEELYLEMRTKGGANIPTMVNAIRRERNGALINDCVIVPMHQRSEYEDQILHARKVAEQAMQAKDEFLAVVSHELRSPLTAVLGWARLLKTGRLSEEQGRHAVDAIARNAEAQATLIGDILDFSRITSGKLRLEVGEVDLARVVEAALDVVRPAAAAKSIVIDATLDPRTGRVSGDASRLQQVLWNLLANAVKFTPKRGRVQVSLAPVDSSVEVLVRDSGRGIDPRFLPFVFEPFRQGQDSTTREQGLGLGLAIAKQLVELHGGTIRAETFQHIGILSLEFHVDKLSRPLL